VGGHLSPRLMGSPPGRAVARRCASRRGSGAAAAALGRDGEAAAGGSGGAAEALTACGLYAAGLASASAPPFLRPSALPSLLALRRSVLALSPLGRPPAPSRHGLLRCATALRSRAGGLFRGLKALCAVASRASSLRLRVRPSVGRRVVGA